MGLFNVFRTKLTRHTVPTVKFDPKRINRAERDDIKMTVAGLPDIPADKRDWLCAVAIEAVQAGRNLSIISQALLGADIPGIGVARAAAISRYVHNRATALIGKRRSLSLGLTEAKWLHSGAACFVNLDGKESLAEAHAAASRMIYFIEDGMIIEGTATWPGRDEGCKCVALPIVPGFES